MIENNDNFIMTYSTLDSTTDLAVIPVRVIAQMAGVRIDDGLDTQRIDGGNKGDAATI
jgi:hypothetical protein